MPQTAVKWTYRSRFGCCVAAVQKIGAPSWNTCKTGKRNKQKEWTLMVKRINEGKSYTDLLVQKKIKAKH